MKAVIFARVSSKEQGEGNSLDAQVSQALNYAIENSLQIVRQFRILEPTVGVAKVQPKANALNLSQSEDWLPPGTTLRSESYGDVIQYGQKLKLMKVDLRELQLVT